MDTFKRNATSLATGGATTQPAQLTTSLTSAQLPTPAVKNTNGGGILYAGAAVGNTDPPAPNSNTLDKESQNCFCFESDDDSAERIRIKNTKKRIARNCVGNIAISILLIFYTLIGAIIFLIVEGGSGMNVRRSESRTKVNSPDNLQLSNNNSNGYLAMSTRNMNSSVNNHTAELLSVIGDGPRTHTVENIWDITVSLNILYRENWTRLAGQELNSFQEMIVQRILEEMHSPGGSTAAAIQGGAEQRAGDQNIIEWNLAKSFLYALTVLTTIGFGSFGPKTAVGKAVTMGYAALGIPLMLIYLTSMGTLLSDCARGVFTRSLCCCLCSNCGYCCYDENRMMEKERRMRRKREMREQERHQMEPFYVRSPSTTFTTTTTSATTNNIHSPTNRLQENTALDNLKLAPGTSTPTATPSSDVLANYDSNSTLNGNSGGHCLAPILLSLIVITIYLCGGAVILCRLEKSWTYLDSLFFCFMTLSTIGSGDTIPSRLLCSNKKSTDLTIWFCSVYIIVGMALTAMSFNIFYCEIVKKFRRRRSSPRNSELNVKAALKTTDKNNISVVDGDLLTNTTTTSYSVNNSFDFITNS